MTLSSPQSQVAKDFLANFIKPFKTILADPPWRFKARNGRISPEYDKCFRYPTLPLEDIKSIPVPLVADKDSHLYLWIPNSMMQDGLDVMSAWGFTYKTSITWEKIRKDGLPDGSGYGHYFRSATETILFGVRGSLNTTKLSHSFPNVIRSRKREHSRKPDEQYALIESCSPGPFLELFARTARKGWEVFGNETEKF
ncbi:MT-A70 family methyltransferase [Flavilitoribacter nigricans]|uniref:S-adenosylmethionine-binding protein n=1 Tax=Flavilitoribacter nigricans (strain ATCC 23147 / DSM 23189 / NBRC 102662 / NCIMB 1420 / SS-2) TaxID=1122177 RepID=A0A2D0MY46_FLAN2|nr:MT-A70 family methyltransferase [Flavilitoribacter nigricans]PHN01137.1 S-adenosylmethionine-binding protein [Flavilitoribacter nigricans DSM 23189 = NBRC 102662]